MANLLNNVGTTMTSMVGWLSTFFDALIANDITVLVLTISIIGVIVGIAFRVIRSLGV